MKTGENKRSQAENSIRRSTLVTVLCDVILIVALVICLLSYISVNNADTYAQNVDSITNIAVAKSDLMRFALERSGHEVEIAYRYCNGKSVRESMAYLAQIGDQENEYQLLRRDETASTEIYHVYEGFSTRMQDGDYWPVRYVNTNLPAALYRDAARELGEICYSRGYTNNTDGQRYFAIFCGIEVLENGKPQKYYLIKPQLENKIIGLLETYTQYGRLDTAVCYADGYYLAKDDSFRADTVYDYLYKYNDLSIDERNAIRDSVLQDEDKSGYLEYQDLKRQDCIFAYAACGEAEDWYVFVSVPVSGFVSEQLLSFFPLILISFLAVLLLFNIWRLLIIVKQLRQSVARERVANMTKSSFLSRMSHEIRTPLNAVIGYNAIAKTEMTGKKSDAQRRQTEMKVMDCLDKSEIASKHLLTVINDVLDMSAIESGKMQMERSSFDFKGLITSLTTVFYSQAKVKNVGFEVIIDTLKEEWFVGDQMRTNQVLTNLLSNAIKFTPEGGSVILKISQPEADKNAAHIRFDVTDTGIGMTKAYLEHIWTPFEQADSSISRRFGGSGLGLSITKSLVDMMGGTIVVQSEPGKGTTFIVDLNFERMAQPANAGPYDFSNVNALVVDDDISTCEYIRMLFNRCGAKCAAVTSGEDAIKAVSLAAEKQEAYTVCLVDWRMPGMDGIETIKRLRNLAGEKLPIIILTAYDFSELADKAAEVGVSRFISKPLFQSSLFDLLASIGGTQPKEIVKQNKSIDFAGARILLAEDNEMNMEIAKRIIESAGLVIDSARNGMEAVEMFEHAPAGTYKLILMDVHMPQMDGHQATRTIRASTHPEAKSIPIIAMTADAFIEDVAESSASGMNDHISKPIDIPTLFATLKKYIQR